MRRSKLLSVLLCIAMLVGLFPMIVTTSAAAPSITLNPTTIEPGNTVFDVICENTDAKDWICVYHSSQTIGKSNHSGWQLAPVGGGTVTFSTDYFYSKDSLKDRIKNTPGGWPLQEGEWTIVLFDNDTYTEILDMETLTVKAFDGIETAYVSNKYGSDENDGATAETAVKTIGKAISLIGTANDGTIVVLDGLDKNGVEEYSVYTRSSSSPYTYGGEQDVLQYVNVPAHTGTITYVGDASDSVICFGMNHLELKGPSVFRNITFIEGYNVGKNLLSLGHDLTFEGTIGYRRTRATGAGTAANKGLTTTGYLGVDVSGRNNTNATGTITAKSGIFDAIAFGGWDKDITLGGDQTIYVDGASVNTIKLRNGSGTWAMQNLAVVVDSGTVGTIADSGAGTCSAKSLQVVINNGLSVPYSATGITLSDGAWIIKSTADETGAKLELTDTVGVYSVVGEKLAIAQDSKGATYVSEDGLLTLPAGEYLVSWTEEIGEDQIMVKYDGKIAQGYFVKGTQIALPALSDTPAGEFVGWTINGKTYNGGDLFTLPTDANEINFVSVWNKIADVAAVFVDAENGSDSNDGLSELTAFATISKAVATVDAATESKKYVVLIGEHKVDASLGTHKNMIIFTGGKLHIYKNSIPVGGPSTLENMTIKYSVASKFVETLGNELVIGENVSFESTASGVVGVSYHVGTSNADGGHESFTQNSGVTQNIYVGAYYNTATRHKTAGADIVINGGNVKTLRFGADGWSGGPTYGVDFTDDVNVTINGGTVTTISQSTGTYAPTFGGAVQVILNNGVKASVPEFEATKGVWVMKGEACDGSSLSATEKAGEFKVNGDLTAVATSADGNIYISASGILAVPVAGEYTVSYTDVVYYTNTGTEVEFLEDYSIAFDDLRHIEKEGKLFIGWVDENGNGVTSTDFKKGDKLFAKYVDCDISDEGDFFIKGVQIRTKEPAGLRFIVEKTDALQGALGVTEYGSVIIPSEVLGTKLLELDKTYAFGGKSYSSKAVEGIRTFADTDDGIQYTVCVINITEDYYRRNYTVRGYIKYTDANGAQKVLYTNSYATNLYTVAKEALKDTTIGDSDRAYLTTIKNYVDETLKQEYMNQTRTDIKGSSADPKTWIYQLGDGVMVREVEIDSGIPGSDVEIVQLSDTHFNYCTEEDLKDPVLASTWENRRAFRYPGTQTALLNSIEYASYSDQIVVTGDAIDYLSQGCVDLLYTYVWNPYPDTIIPLGNHEPVKKMQGTVAETTTVAERYEQLKKVWKHDVYYTEKILKNDEGTEKVMIIQMDNSQRKFWDHQVPLFKASIEKAKEKGLPILLFTHIPFVTRNPADASMDAIRINDTTSSPANFYNDGSFISDTGTGATKQIYDLIAMNPDVVKAHFCGHWHCDFYTEIWSKNADGTDNKDVVIPQYILTGSAYDKGHALRITVK